MDDKKVDRKKKKKIVNKISSTGAVASKLHLALLYKDRW